ncbi:unnamed protein product [Discula destructiva]
MTGLMIAGDTLWNWAAEHQPEWIKQWAPHGYHDLLLDKTAMGEMGFGYNSSDFYTQFFKGFRGVSVIAMRSVLYHGIGNLRNAAYHWKWYNASPKTTHQYLLPVLQLTQCLAQEANERRMCQLMNWLEQEATKSSIFAQEQIAADGQSQNKLSDEKSIPVKFPDTPMPEEVTDWAKAKMFETHANVEYDKVSLQNFLGRTNPSPAARVKYLMKEFDYFPDDFAPCSDLMLGRMPM